jgi:6-phosphogluconolactonase
LTQFIEHSLFSGTFLSFGQEKSRTFLYVGSYTSGEIREGIYVYSFNNQTGELTEVEIEDKIINPSFITISPNGNFLYACTDTKLDVSGSISAFKIDSTSGQIHFLNKQSTKGRNPVHVIVDNTNQYIIASNYTDSGICLFKSDSTGRIESTAQLINFEGSSVIEGRQDNSHIHSCNFSLDNKYLFSPDLGSDKIHVFSFDFENLLNQIDTLTVKTNPGAGPRHFTFHPTLSKAYCVDELSGEVTSYNYHDGQLSQPKSYFSYQQKQEEYASSDIHISPDGKYLYVSNRQDENTISIFEINSLNGELTLKASQNTLGEIPRNFVIDPTGNYLIVANQISDELVVFKRNSETGLLTYLNSVKGIQKPSSLKMVQYGE